MHAKSHSAYTITTKLKANKGFYVNNDEEMVQLDAQGPSTAYKCDFQVKSLSALGSLLRGSRNVQYAHATSQREPIRLREACLASLHCIYAACEHLRRSR